MQNISLRVELAFSAFFRRVRAGEKPGFPRAKGDGYDSFCFPGASVGYAVVNGGLRLSKITEPNSTIKMCLHRPIVGKVKTCCIQGVPNLNRQVFSAYNKPCLIQAFNIEAFN